MLIPTVAASSQTQMALCLQGVISMLTFTFNELYFPGRKFEPDAALPS